MFFFAYSQALCGEKNLKLVITWYVSGYKSA